MVKAYSDCVSFQLFKTFVYESRDKTNKDTQEALEILLRIHGLNLIKNDLQTFLEEGYFNKT